MNRQELEQIVAAEYAVTPEYLWEGDNITAALRHQDTKKWFGVLMRISARKLNLDSNREVDVAVIKLDPDLIQELIAANPGKLFPAYHMNKKHWLTILLDETVDADLVKALINDSYRLTL